MQYYDQIRETLDKINSNIEEFNKLVNAKPPLYKDIVDPSNQVKFINTLTDEYLLISRFKESLADYVIKYKSAKQSFVNTSVHKDRVDDSIDERTNLTRSKISSDSLFITKFDMVTNNDLSEDSQMEETQNIRDQQETQDPQETRESKESDKSPIDPRTASINIPEIPSCNIEITTVSKLSDMKPAFYYYNGVEKVNGQILSPGVYMCFNKDVYARCPFPMTVSSFADSVKTKSIRCKYKTLEKCTYNKKQQALKYNNDVCECYFTHIGEKYVKTNYIPLSVQNYGNPSMLMNDVKKIELNDIKYLLLYGMTDLFNVFVWLDYKNKSNQNKSNQNKSIQSKSYQNKSNPNSQNSQNSQSKNYHNENEHNQKIKHSQQTPQSNQIVTVFDKLDIYT